MKRQEELKHHHQWNAYKCSTVLIFSNYSSLHHSLSLLTQSMKELHFDQLFTVEDGNGGGDSLDDLDSSIFFNEIPSFSDFHSISSSSSSSTPAEVPTPSSGCSASSWGKFPHEEAEQHVTPQLPTPTNLIGGGSGGGGCCMDVMEDFGYLDLMDSDDMWDPSSIFEVEEERNSQALDNELRAMFFEWLKSNKEKISAEDMRNIKFKRATIESASKRLGTSVEGKKQLLKLILEWVENYQLQKKQQQQLIGQVPNTNFSQFGDCMSNCLLPPPPPQYGSPMAGYSPACGYGRDLNVSNYVLETAQTWPPANCAMMAQQMQIPSPAPVQALPGRGNQYPFQTANEKLVRWASSVTKEARKKRMARQKRYLFLHRNPNGGDGGCGTSNAVIQPDSRNLTNWPCRLTGPAAAAEEALSVIEVSLPAPAQNNQQSQATSEKREEPNTGSNFKFLLQKVLKQSDVGNLGRIVLPKKESEAHLPQLDSRDGIQIALEDIATSRVWNMRYRFWPNNKSRMYLLENTGDFVKENKLEEGDFIVIYSDVKCGKYLIRAVKLRQVVAPGCEPVKKPAKKKKSRKEQDKAMQ